MVILKRILNSIAYNISIEKFSSLLAVLGLGWPLKYDLVIKFLLVCVLILLDFAETFPFYNLRFITLLSLAMYNYN